ncbi:hypothetical protein Poli38472_007983 [Pythium oligandrum]|uniref:Peptidase C45 hydrolase domain-containing protein n=1 Tax=Pythium oligandrum TaxID=41045 RepID=A0A8K1FJV5_PYTOL|nr:hypothetical protein Poli38472_007983 [Pythium oligandrum]|eukprot:TMW65341.1 hypothetical protein Poli38472_007983 [Pythium oligandrum]
MTVSMTPSVSAWTSANVAVLEQFEYQGNSHFDFGKAMGARFREKIAERLAQNTKLQTRLLPYVQTTTEGKSIYAAFLETHETTFPEYMEELRGIANGSGIFFETIFVMNLSEEFDDAVPETYTAGAGSAFIKQKTLRCSDVVLVGGPDDLRVVAHNEDSGASDLNHTAIIIAKIGDKPKFVAYTYLGDLPSGAFGFNDKGVAFTLNFVQPTDTETGGLGRGFISRDLLWSTDSADAMQRIMRPHQASGHNYQLMDVNTKRIWNVEGAALNRYAGQEFLPPRERNNVTAFFHANQYQLLNISQPPYDSSLHRLKRYSESPKPKTVDEALQILGDQHDRLYPVFHDVYSHERGELSGWTLITIVFDLNAKKAVSYTGNPSKGQRELIWDLEQLTVEKISVQALA